MKLNESSHKAEKATSRISRNALTQAIRKVSSMDLKQKEQLADEVFRDQPNMLAASLVLKQFGVSLAKMDFVIDILLICFQAMKESGLVWPVISEDEQERQMRRYVATVKFNEDLSASLKNESLRQYIDNHPEKALLAYVQTETASWLTRVVPEESDTYVMIAAATFVNCIAHVPLPQSQSMPNHKRTGKEESNRVDPGLARKDQSRPCYRGPRLD